MALLCVGTSNLFPSIAFIHHSNIVFLLFLAMVSFLKRKGWGKSMDYLIELNKERVGVAIPSYVNKA